VLAVPQRANHIRKAEVSALEGDQHFVADFGDHYEPAIVARHRHGKTRPVTFPWFFMPGIADLDATQPLYVVVLRDQTNRNAFRVVASVEPGFGVPGVTDGIHS